MDCHQPLSSPNPAVLTGWSTIWIRKATKGDHIKCYSRNIKDCIVKGIDSESRKLVVIGCEVTGTHSVVRRKFIDIEENFKVEKAKYCRSDNSAIVMKRAISRIGTRKDVERVSNVANFAMWCMTGKDRSGENIYITRLKPGDHIVFGQPNTHGIVDSIILPRIECITFNTSIGSTKKLVCHGQKQVKRVEYNTCCSVEDSLRLARETQHTSFRSDKEFAAFCRKGCVGEALKHPLVKEYPPRKRQYNADVITGWKNMHVTELCRGDHVCSENDDIPHSIVEHASGDKITLIGCQKEKNKLVIKRYERTISKETKNISVAVYSSCVNSGSAVKKAISLIETDRVKAFVDNEIDFAILCKKGDEIEWEDTVINRLRVGDHIKYGHWKSNAIVEYVDPERRAITCIANKISNFTGGVRCVEVIGQTCFKRAVYNSSFDNDTVVRLAQSRMAENKYHPFDNDGFQFAKWCKTGKAEKTVATRTLVLSHDMLKPGDQVSWTRWLTYDHHALVKNVLGPNEIEVYEFTVNKGSKVVGKTFKRLSRVPIFNGDDPVYKIMNTPAEDPAVLLAEAEKQVGQYGGYNLLTNSCQNYVANSEGFEAQARGFFAFIKELVLRLSTKVSSTTLAGCIEDAVRASLKVAKFGAITGMDDAGDKAINAGLKTLTTTLHEVGFFIPFPIEIFMILWDINHDWADHKKTRIIIGVVGTLVTSAIMTGIALPAVSLGLSIGLFFVSLFVGIVGTALTVFAMRSVRRITDRNRCREAFAGLYEFKTSKIKEYFEKVAEKIQRNSKLVESFIKQIMQRPL